MPNQNMVLADMGLGDALAAILQSTVYSPLPWVLRLNVQDYDPLRDMTFSNFQELITPGYSAIQLDRANWTTPVVSGGVAVSTWGTVPIQWTLTATDQTIFGYWVQDDFPPRMRYAQRFAVPVVLDHPLLLTLLPEYRYASADPPPVPPLG